MTTSNTTPQIDDRTSADIIWATIQDLHTQGQVCSRSELQAITGLRRIRDGVFAPMMGRPEPEAVSMTELPEGLVIIEAGDQQLRVNEATARRIARMFQGYAMQFSNMQTQHDMGAILTEFTVRNRHQADEILELRKVVQQLQRKVQDGDAGQMGLPI